MLRACRRVLKPGASLAFFVVAVADGLSGEETIRAIEAGPAYVEANLGYRDLVEMAGFIDVGIIDVTGGYRSVLAKSIRLRDASAAELSELVGADTFTEGQASRRRELLAIDDGLLRRLLVSGVRPHDS